MSGAGFTPAGGVPMHLAMARLRQHATAHWTALRVHPVAAVAVVGAIVVATAPVAPPPVRTWVAWLLLTVLHVLFCREAWVVVRDRRSTTTTRRLWGVFLAAVLLFLAGDVAQLAHLATHPWSYEAAFGVPAQELLLVAGAGLVLLAAAAMPVRTGSVRETVRFSLDMGVVVLAVAAAAVLLDPSTPTAVDVVAIAAGPMVFALIALALLKLAVTPDRPFTRAAGWLLGTAALGEALLTTLTLRGDLATSLTLINGLALASNALLTLGARAQRCGPPVVPVVPVGGPRALRLGRLPYVAVVTTNALLVWTLLHEGLTARAWVVLGATTCSIALVLLRQFLLLSEQQELVGHLNRTLAERDALTRRLEHLAYHDALTGLASRRRFEEVVEEATRAAAARTDVVPGGGPSVMLIDLDGFKEVNDRHGHEAGDAVLLAVADRLRTCVRGEDTVARFGGDELAVVLDEGADGAAALARRMVALVGRPVQVPGAVVQVGASVGVATFGPAVRTAGDLVRQADAAMYVAKSRGGHQVVGHAEIGC